MHLAQIELALVAASFFRDLNNVELAPSMQDKDMIAEDVFILTPRGHRCMVVVSGHANHSDSLT
jgi:hypothetical protein